MIIADPVLQRRIRNDRTGIRDQCVSMGKIRTILRRWCALWSHMQFRELVLVNNVEWPLRRSNGSVFASFITTCYYESAKFIVCNDIFALWFVYWINSSVFCVDGRIHSPGPTERLLFGWTVENKNLIAFAGSIVLSPLTKSHGTR